MKKEILIIRLSSIGDVIHCSPVAGALKAAWPDCRLTWLVGEVCADLIKYNPLVDEMIVWSRERFEKYLRACEFKKALSLWQSLQACLRARVFYAVLDIHGLFLTGLIARQVNTGRRIGLSGAREFNPLFMTETAEPLGPHITEKYLGVLTALGITPGSRQMTLAIPPAAVSFAEHFITGAGITRQDRIAVLVPGTTWPAKNWPPALFARTAALLSRDFKIILCGGKNELAMGQEIGAQAGIPVTNAIGKTSLLEMAGILARAAVVVAGDTGPLYMAAALATPTVALFGPTNPETYAPPGRHHRIAVNKLACSFCHKMQCQHGRNDCMNSITPAAVVQQVYQVLGLDSAAPTDRLSN
ncbi:glycosyltransferase family 9 protein [Sporomusa termitida]|uniref:Lipopolysaccharide core heptosyltransferase RfaQ n=1 Tax=Sporomusa termitida TaxID=2377 RepID=A0A517DRK4_9FIRM|nr:glycosyltransferase family 9 protein [Sporomusa termitida]QDR79991.1 Lipopolysaccharide core heptosyltransferase RfaQ [Sporomusa termitida]